MNEVQTRPVNTAPAQGLYNRVVKRGLDLTLAAAAGILLSPVILTAGAAVKFSSKGPVIFRQKRLGKGGKEFDFYKFRSMVVDAEKTGSGVYSGKGDPRVTKVGRILRASSIDELPQLWNILKGDMSLIGPRPPLTYHPWPISQYTPNQRKMFTVRPGITGWAQVNGRRSIDWNERIRLNNWYIEHLSFALDCKILWKTVEAVLSNDNNANTGATIPPTPED